VGPVRVYDSRKYPDDTGRITGGEERLVGIGVWPGSQQPFPVVPDHVQAVVSLTLDATQGSGYLALLAPDDHYLFHSNINWYADGQIIAVTTIAGVGEGASVWVKAGGPGSTHFTIDVLGYFD